MSKYTKAERHEIYKKAKTFLIELFEHNNELEGVCYGIKMNSIFSRYYEINGNEFPELYMFTPSDEKPDVHESWLYPDEYSRDEAFNMRQTVLEFMIEMTRPC